jgi:ubiquinone/menaquinone biosynthesis C-methylase UbiE
MSRLGSAAVGYVGHQVHVVRRREAGWLLDALGDVRDKTVVDIAGGDGYWAAQLTRRGAYTVAIDLAEDKLHRGRGLPAPPGLIKGDALRLPFPDASVDATLSICAIEHFPDGKAALAEMARITRSGGSLAMSADALCAEERWPDLSKGHRERYHVVDTYDEDRLSDLLDAEGFDVLRTEYLFREVWAQSLYMRLHRWKYAPNALAPLAPLVAVSDKRSDTTGGAILLVHAKRR